MIPHRRHRRLWIVALWALALSGCATYADRLKLVRGKFALGDISAADAEIEKGIKRRSDRDVCQLDRAILQLADGKSREAERTLRDVRDRFDQLEKPAVGEKALSMLTDANQEAYSGEDYEKVLIRVFLAISNLMADGADAGAYAFQITDKQQQIILAGGDKQGQNLKANYKQVAVGPYLVGAMREATHGNFDDVERARAAVCSWQPDFPFAAQDLDRARHGSHSAPGNGVLYVFTLVGIGPHKEETIEAPSSISLLIADQIISAMGKQSLPPTIAPIKVPKVVATYHPVGSIGVAVNGQPMGRTATITDIGQMAVQQHEAVFPRIVAEAVVRRVVKKSVIYGVKEATGTERNSAANLALDLAGVAWEATESADTRCWGMLPDKIQVLRIELPAGARQVALQPLGASGYPLGRPVTQNVTIVDGRNTYLLANFPSAALVGKVLTNTP